MCGGWLREKKDSWDHFSPRGCPTVAHGRMGPDGPMPIEADEMRWSFHTLKLANEDGSPYWFTHCVRDNMLPFETDIL